jgi:hypothetical protein
MRLREDLTVWGVALDSEESTVVDGPDFICIGMPKAGTGWLHDQLKFHPDFWMSPVKELAYLNRKLPPLRNALSKHGHAQADPERRRTTAKRHRRKWTDRDFAFLNDAAALAGQKRDLDRYVALFRHKGTLKSGDITPGYALMGADVIAEIAAKLPHVKVIFLIRDPVARLWSHINHFHNEDRFDPALLEDNAAFNDFLDNHQPILDHSKPTQILARWKEAAPSIAFQHYFFDDIAQNPKRTRHKILRFLDAKPRVLSADLPHGYNRKAGKAKLVMTDPIRNIIRDRLADELRACASLLGGPARKWPGLYGL